jgi:hypothetical protein
MSIIIKQTAMAMVCVGTIFLFQSSAQSVVAAPDLVGMAWKTRAETATKKLALPGLDKCDKGVELAFQQYQEVALGNKRNFALMIEIDKQAMVASYTYEGQLLDSFVLRDLPQGWIVVQKTGSKTLNILVEDSNCSFALCTNDPFTAGACLEQGKR